MIAISTPAATPADSFIAAHCLQARIRETDYRADVDGLRAIAILSVIGFHAFPAWLPGGFVGVDIFFVISGYLISKHIFTELAAGGFSTKAFYVRRVRRIFPALIMTLLACTAFGWVVLTPGEYELMGRHIAGGAGFVANLVFWREAGYFDVAADTKPLLHLWSLGIEEQFYILWPFILTLLWRRARAMLGRVILGLLFVSFVYAVWLVYRDATAAFYSPFARFWELALGAMLAYDTVHRKFEVPDLHRQALSWVGLGFILSAVVLIDASRRFPGAWALLPTVGAACLIHSGGGAGGAAWLNRVALVSRPLVWIGLISYPLYLWHWPLLSFARVLESTTPTLDVRLALVGLSIVLAWMTYRFVELPVRGMPIGRAKTLMWVLGLTMLLLFAAGVAIRKLDGVKFRALSRLNGDVGTLSLGADRNHLHKECGLPEPERQRFQFCLSSDGEAPRFAVLGDSKAEALFYGLARESKPGMRGVLIGSVRPPKRGAPATDSRQTKNRLALQSVLDDPAIKVVVFIVALRSTFPVNGDTGFVEGNVAPAMADGIAAYSDAIHKIDAAGKRAMFVIDNPTLPDPRSCISGGMTSSDFLNQFIRRNPNARCTIRYADHLAGTKVYRQFAADILKANPSLTIYDPTSLLCDTSRDECSISRDGKFLYSYSDHISDYANTLIAREMYPVLEKLAR